MKPGWQTSEFWIALIGQLLALLALAGAIPLSDKDRLETALASAVTAVFTLLTSAVMVTRYIRSRSELKSQVLETQRESGPPVLPLVLLGLLCLAVPASAASPAPAVSVERTCLFQRPSRTDPQLLALLQQLAQNQQTIIGLLQQQRQPAPQPLLVLPPQTIPLGGAPRQDIPLGAAPRHDIPLGGPPRQELPLGPPPRQDVPLGPPPRQELPLGPAPRQDIAPGEVKPAPAAMQRYVRTTVYPVQ
ncbi:MAG: hypothetical protein JNM56_39130 [Planctomycetia bacterium]|nr:hypothetical protein [Planctomycetia bacterium]